MYQGHLALITRLCPKAHAIAWLLLLLGSAISAHAQSLIPIPGSPFFFSEPQAGSDSQVVALSPDEQHLFVSNPGSASITVLNVDAGGALTLVGKFPTDPGCLPTGLALNPTGDRLYVTTFFCGTVNVHSIASDGSLSQLEAEPVGTFSSSALNGIVYVSLPTGDFVYVNNDNNDEFGENTVSAFSVNPSDGTLDPLAPTQIFLTDGFGGGCCGFFASPRLTAFASGRHLFVLNLASNDVSVFDIQDDGSLTPIAGSPFTLGTSSSGPIAVDPAGNFLYAGSFGTIVKFSIDASGALTSLGNFSPGFTTGIDGLAVHPSGGFITVTGPNENRIATLETATMTPTPLSPRFGDGCPTGIVFNATGTLAFVGNCGGGTSVSVYEFGEPPPPLDLGLSVDPRGSFVLPGDAVVRGTLNCSRPVSSNLSVELRQKVSRTLIIRGFGSLTVDCDGVTPWSVTLRGENGPFKGGPAVANVSSSAFDPVRGEFKEASVSQRINLSGAKK